MKHRIALLAVSALVVSGMLLPTIAEAQRRRTTARPAPARPMGESALLGVRLYDSGVRLIQMFGSPNEIQPVTFGGGAIGPVGGAPGGRPGMGAPGRGGGSGAPMGAQGAEAAIDQFRPWTPGDFSITDEELRQAGPPAGFGGPPGGFGGPPGAQSMPGGGRGFGGPPGGFGGPPGGFGGPGGPPGGVPGRGGVGGGATSADRVTFTRWVYNRPGSKYAFILDRQNRVVQIEALGLSDGRVRTARGVSFGTTFGDIIRRYGAPDGYEISGSNIVMRYLVRNKVAFRLSQLGENRPHTVTGVVVAGGKM